MSQEFDDVRCRHCYYPENNPIHDLSGPEYFAPIHRYEPAPAEQPRVCPKCDDEGCDYCNADPKLSASPAEGPRPESAAKKWLRELLNHVGIRHITYACFEDAKGKAWSVPDLLEAYVAAQPSPDAAKVAAEKIAERFPVEPGDFSVNVLVADKPRLYIEEIAAILRPYFPQVSAPIISAFKTLREDLGDVECASHEQARKIVTALDKFESEVMPIAPEGLNKTGDSATSASLKGSGLAGEATLCSVCAHPIHTGECREKLVTDGSQCPCIMAGEATQGPKLQCLKVVNDHGFIPDLCVLDFKHDGPCSITLPASAPEGAAPPESLEDQWAARYLTQLRNAIFATIPEDQKSANSSDDALVAWPGKLAAEVAELRAKPRWECFHCEFTTSDKTEAAAHFGDGEGETSLCIEWANLSKEDRLAEYQSMLQELSGERERAEAVEAQLKTAREALQEAISEVREHWVVALESLGYGKEKV